MREHIERIALRVEHPGRYVVCESLLPRKERPQLRVAVSYPDLYEVGMANQGIRRLYEAANRVDDVLCERVFAVAPDFEHELRQSSLPLYTLETFTPLDELDLLGLNIAHELVYTDVLQILDLGRIPLRAADRAENHPLVMAGGEALANPFPGLAFLDLVFFGEGDEAMGEICATLRELKARGAGRREKIEALAGIEGVADASTLQEGVPAVRRRALRNGMPQYGPWPVPAMRGAVERAVVEVGRGCDNLCAFCHAGYYNLPCRNFAPEDIARAAFAEIERTGFNEISLNSLSIGDHPALPRLVNLLLPEFNRRGITISLPSLRVDRTSLPVIEAISDIRRSSLTFAVEAADDNLRRKIHKRLTIAELLEIIEYVFERGWKRIKLYFMIGLPGYEEADEAASIIELLRQITAIGRGRCDINATISPFVPKPHTPLERARMAPPEYLDDTVRRIRNGVSKKVAVKNHNIRSSIVEGILARGGRECSDLIETVYAAGARLDSWKEYFRAPIWYDTLDSRYPEWREMLRDRPAPEVLPWKAVDAGNTKLIEVRSRDLRPEEMKPRRGADTSVLDLEAFAAARGEFEKNFEMRSRLLVAVTKTGSARFVSHLDMLDTVKRGLRQLGLPMTFTQGFNKQERVSAAWPLPLGYESIEELFVADLCDDYDPALFTRSEFVFADGMVARWAAPYTRKNALMAEICSSRYLVKSDRGYLERAVARAASRPALVKRSKNGSEKAVTFEDTVLDLRLTDEGLEVHVPLGVPGALRPDDLLTQLTGEALAPGWRVIRLAQYTLENGEQMPFDRLAVTV